MAYTYLFTGATSAVGRTLVARLLHRPRIYPLISHIIIVIISHFKILPNPVH